MGGVQKAAAGLAPAYSFSAYVAEVEVDVDTGLIKCTDVWAAHDCGKLLNPLNCRRTDYRFMSHGLRTSSVRTNGLW